MKLEEILIDHHKALKKILEIIQRMSEKIKDLNECQIGLNADVEYIIESLKEKKEYHQLWEENNQ